MGHNLRPSSIWLSLVLTVYNRLVIVSPNNGLQTIIADYNSSSPRWLPEFSREVLPVPCHSHNDYMHRVPLYEGVAAGCVSMEADIWYQTPSGTPDLLVGHNLKSLKQDRTLKSLYLDPLFEILTQQNTPSNSTKTRRDTIFPMTNSTSDIKGVFDSASNTSLVLILDFKTGSFDTWDLVMSQLSPFREKGWLTTWTSSQSLVSGPLTIVASGASSLSWITSNDTYHDL